MNEELTRKNTTKLLLISILLVALGLGSIWFGFESQSFNSESRQEITPFPIATAAESIPLGQEVKVERVIDGDTIEIKGGEKVRLIGIDTPETVDPRRPVSCFGKEASDESKKLMEDKVVTLQRDVSETDNFGRLLRYVYIKQEDGKLLFVNDYLVRQGYARVATFPPDVKLSQQFLEAEREARAESRGLWGSCQG